MTIVELSGCAPQPLAHYLKALGILRLVAEQKDPHARGWWRGERFMLAGSLDEAALRRFFLEEYRPSALVSPWNKGAGFFRADDPGMAPVERSTAQRFEIFRAGIAAARAQLTGLGQADAAVREIKERTKKQKGMTSAQATRARQLRDDPEYKKELALKERLFAEIKESFIPQCRLQWRGVHLEWMDAALVIDGDGSAMFPSLLGTGGNDGRLDFTNNFMQRLADLFDLTSADGMPKKIALPLLATALFGDPGKDLSQQGAFGQYLPGLTGGANSSTGFSGGGLMNHWDYVLMLEGALLFRAHAIKRLGTEDPVKAAAPFAVAARPSGYGSAGKNDDASRGEQWMPLWDQPMTLAEFKHLLSEGRAKLKRAAAREPLELARGMARLGVARGISAFQRYGYIERNGQSNLAVPLGRFYVPDKMIPELELLDDLDNRGWLAKLRREARADNAAGSFKQAEKNLADELFSLTQQPSTDRWLAVLLALADIEDVMAGGAGFNAGPIPPLQPGWLTAANDHTPEFRLAAALALAHGGFEKKRWIDSVRRHALPFENGRFKTSSEGGKARLMRSPEWVMHGRDPESDCIALVLRRLIESEQGARRVLPLETHDAVAAQRSDLAAMISGRVDLARTLRLARTLMAVEIRKVRGNELRSVPAKGEFAVWPDDGWLAIRLALLPWAFKEQDKPIGADPAIVRQLAAGNASRAVELAVRRLRAKGINVPFSSASVDPALSRLWAAALAFPISQKLAQRFCQRLEKFPEEEPKKTKKESLHA